MDNYKVLKENELDLEVGSVHDEASVDSLCSMDYPDYDDGCECRDCIDCLVIHGIVVLCESEEAQDE